MGNPGSVAGHLGAPGLRRYPPAYTAFIGAHLMRQLVGSLPLVEA